MKQADKAMKEFWLKLASTLLVLWSVTWLK
jgi:hypothetical protein